MLRIIIWICCPLILLQCHQATKEQQVDHYNITAELTGFADSTLFYLLDMEKQARIDSAFLQAGQLQFSGRVDHPIPARLYTPTGETINFWIEHRPIHIQGKSGDLDAVTITGSPLNAEMLELQHRLAPLQQTYDSIFTQLMPLMYSDTPEEASLGKALNANVAAQHQQQIAYLYERDTASAFSLYLLFALRNHIGKDSLQTLYNRLPPDLQQSTYGQVIKSIGETDGPPEIGNDVREVVGLTPTGAEQALSDLTAPYILLEFWASWCGPCRADNPALVKTYQDYQAKGFEIFGFSIDNNKAAWKQAIAADQLPWTNVIGADGQYDIYAARYRVSSIPANFLIGPDRKIVDVNLRGNHLRARLAELLGE